MPAVAAVWDEELLGAPEWQPYSVQRPVTWIRSSQLWGAPLFTRTARARPRLIAASVIQDATQYAAFEAWVPTIDGGQSWFTIGLYSPAGRVTGAGHLEAWQLENLPSPVPTMRITMQLDWLPDA